MVQNGTTNRVAGTCFIAANGKTLRVKSSIKIMFGTELKTEVVGQDGFHGYKSQFQVPKISMLITDTADLDVVALLKIEGATVTAQMPGSKTRVLRDAFQSGKGELNVDEGELEVEFTGRTIEEC